MKKRAIVLLLGVVLLTSSGAFWAAVYKPWEPGPRYKGMTVAYWSRAIKEGRPLGGDSLVGKLEQFFGLYDQVGRPAILNGDAATIPVLVRLLTGEDREAALAARATLLRVAASPSAGKAVRALTEACNDEDPDVRIAVSRILQMGRARAEFEIRLKRALIEHRAPRQ
jgi:hypothetical protein